MKEEREDVSMDWDSEIDQDGGGFATLPDNTEVTFTVTKLVKARTSDGKKPMAKVELACEALDGIGRTTVRENLVLSSAAAWKLGEFFRAIGQRRHGESVKPDWDAVPESTGRALLGVEEWTGRDGDKRRSNKVKRFLDPVDESNEASEDAPSFG